MSLNFNFEFETEEDLNVFLKAKKIPQYPNGSRTKYWDYWECGCGLWGCCDYPCLLKIENNKFFVSYFGEK